ncbi:MAG TPA: S41 family peptidase [Ramlibacter sp.]|nr:S41 family peptidase [Ramlibacter sp.]
MKFLYLAVLCGLLQACGGGGGGAEVVPEAPAEPLACSVTAQRESLRTYMQDRYYWYSQLQAPAESAPNMDAYFQSMLWRPTDRFSFTESTALHNQVFTDGRRTGYGYVLVWGDAAQTTLRVRSVEPLSPVARAGLARGDTIISIDGLGTQDIVRGVLPIVAMAGVPRSFRVRTAAGVEKRIEAVSEDYVLSPVATSTTMDIMRNGAPAKVGYLAYTQFTTYSVANLNLALTRFGLAGIEELVLDLRYNGGGSVGASRDLASMIGGAGLANHIYAYLRFNDKQADLTQQVYFNSSAKAFAFPLPQGLRRVVVITSGGTASASELLINGLRPFVDVVLVGETTYGKPYGFIPRDNCGLTYNAVQFESLNSQGVGGYTAGFAPHCQVADDLDHQLGDAAERRVRVALNYLATGSCGPLASPKGAVARARMPQEAFGETWPTQMFTD